MQNQGQARQINFGGIVRNTAGSTAPDGEFEEIVNLRWKNGHFVPIRKHIKVTDSDNKPLDVTGYTYIYIHSNDYQHFIGYKNGHLWYFADMDNQGYANRLQDGEVDLGAYSLGTGDMAGIKYTQTGNLLTVIDDSGVHYQYWRKKEYVNIGTDYNGSATDEMILPEGRIDFRLAQRKYEGTNEPCVRLLMLSDGAGNPTGTNHYDNNAIKTSAQSLITKAREVARKRGELTGYFYVCTAIKLYDGNYILQSRPILITPPVASEDYSDFVSTRIPFGITTKQSGLFKTEFRSTFYPNTIKDTADMYWEMPLTTNINLFDGNGGYTFDDTVRTTKTSTLIQKVGGSSYGGTYKGLNVARCPMCVARWGIYGGKTSLLDRICEDVNGTSYSYSGAGKDYDAVWMQCFDLPHILQYKLNLDIDQSYEDIIESVCVFMTEEIEPSKINNKSLDDIFFNGINCYSGLRENDDCIEALHNLNNFYKIKEIKFSDLKKTDSWIDIDLEKDAILQNLVQQETLNLDASDRNAYKPKVSLMYNGRLHLANYAQVMFRGWPYNYFKYQNGGVNGQWPEQYSGQTYISNPSFIYTDSATGQDVSIVNKWAQMGVPYICIETTIDTTDGEYVVKRYSLPKGGGKDSPIVNLNPIISYPDRRAKEMRFVIQYCDSATHKFHKYDKTFELQAHSTFDFAYYQDKDLKPINPLEGAAHTEIAITATTIDNIAYLLSSSLYKIDSSGNEELEYVPNGLRVSEVNNPLYFPAKNTYKEGNMEIIAMAVNAVRMPYGQTGDANLYVFARDGVYGLFVNDSGEITYTNSAPICRDVCNNWRSVTPTDMGVVFSTFRGLMLLSGREVQDISDPTEGKVLDFTNSLSNDYLEALAKTNTGVINNLQLAGKESADYVSAVTDEFLEFIKGCIIGYNSHEREIWVSNPTKVNGAHKYKYSYILSKGIWLKVGATCEEYVENYPETYMNENNMLSILGKEDNSNSTIFWLTRPIKLLTQEFKQAYRVIIRGLYKLEDATVALWKYITPTVQQMKLLAKKILIKEKETQTITALANTTPSTTVTLNNPTINNLYISKATAAEKIYRNTTDIKVANNFKHRYIYGSESQLTRQDCYMFDTAHIVTSNAVLTDDSETSKGKLTFTMAHELITSDYEIRWGGVYRANVYLVGLNGGTDLVQLDFSFNSSTPNIEIESTELFGRTLYSLQATSKNQAGHIIRSIKQKHNIAVQYKFYYDNSAKDIVIAPSESASSQQMTNVFDYNGAAAVLNFYDALTIALYNSSDWYQVYCSNSSINWSHQGASRIDTDDYVELHILDTLYHTGSVVYKQFGGTDDSTAAEVFSDYQTYDNVIPKTTPIPLVKNTAYKLYLDGMYINRFYYTDNNNSILYNTLITMIPTPYSNDFYLTTESVTYEKGKAYKIQGATGTIWKVIHLKDDSSYTYQQLLQYINNPEYFVPFVQWSVTGEGEEAVDSSDLIAFTHENYYKVYVVSTDFTQTQYTPFVAVLGTSPTIISAATIVTDMEAYKDTGYPDDTSVGMYYNIAGRYQFSPIVINNLTNGQYIHLVNYVYMNGGNPTIYPDFVYSGPSSIDAYDMIRNLISYKKKPVTQFEDDLVLLPTDKNVTLVKTDSTSISFYSEKSRYIDYTQLLSDYTAGKLPAVFTLDDVIIKGLNNPDYLKVTHINSLGIKRVLEFTYEGASSISAQDLLDNYDDGEYDPLPSYDPATGILLPTGQNIVFTDLSNNEYKFIIPATSSEDILVPYSNIVSALTNQTGKFVTTSGEEYSYTLITTDPTAQACHAGLYIFGSYDARKWMLLGWNELPGTFRDLGALVERVDCKYFRIGFGAKLTPDSYIDYIDVTSTERLLTGKIR